jgi:hypothetical protein
MRNAPFRGLLPRLALTWFFAAIITASMAFAARMPPFNVDPPLVQLIALGTNGLCFWLGSLIFFRKPD